MPIRMPEVNGTDCLPASSSTCRRTAGTLSGQLWCGMPFSCSRSEVDSIMIPMEPDTGLRVARSVHDITPGLRWGMSPVSSITWIAAARR